jgi:hypothetical protein
MTRQVIVEFDFKKLQFKVIGHPYDNVIVNIYPFWESNEQLLQFRFDDKYRCLPKIRDLYKQNSNELSEQEEQDLIDLLDEAKRLL